MAREGCGAVINLALDAESRRELGRIGGCDAVVKALIAFGGTDNRNGS